HTGVAAATQALEEWLQVRRFKVRGDHPGDQAAGPLVEVTQDNTAAGKMRIVQDLVADEHRSLLPALKIALAEMQVEQVKQRAVGQLHIGTDATAIFAPTRSKVIVLVTLDRETAEDRVPIRRATDLARLAETAFVSGKMTADDRQLIVLTAAADDFLQRD